MTLLQHIKRKVRLLVQGKKEMDAVRAYDRWAATYDDQPGNLMIYLDDEVFTAMMESVAVENQVVADIGCGTGRHWPKLLAHHPLRLIGYDVSAEMLDKLRRKFPAAETHVLKEHLLPELPDGTCDMIICNLALGYMKNLPATLQEWDRVLKNGGLVFITDMHPEALQKGAERSFAHGKEKVVIKNYLHTFPQIQALAKALHWKEQGFTERRVDEAIKFFYEKQNALHIYEQSHHTALLYGWLFKKAL